MKVNMKVNCFGNKVSSLHCKIVLLDDQQLVHEVSVSDENPIVIWRDRAVRKL